MNLRPAVALWLAVLAFPSIAIAGPSLSDKATAQALFDDALKLMADKHYAEACPKLEESERLDPAMGTRFRLSECNEGIGRTASAWAGYSEVADQARTAGLSDRERAARERAASLEPRLTRIVIAVEAPDTAGLEVRRGDVVVGKGQWGTPTPVDPGHFTMTATAPGKVSWKGDVTAGGEGTTSVVTVPRLLDAPATPGVPPVDAPAASAPSPAAPATEPTSTGSTQRTVGIVALGAGVVGVGLGGILGLVAKSNYDGAGAHCQGAICDAQGKQTTDDARGLATVATVVFGVGAAAAAGGVILWLTAPAAHPNPPTARVRIVPRGVLVEGSF